MRETYSYSRKIPCDDSYDIVVAGGGPAGAAAAICAGRLGARVLLIEAMGCLGGLGTCGLVNAFDPMANGEEMLVGGFMRELVETMYARGFINPDLKPDTWRKKYHAWTQFKGEGLKLLLDEFAKEANVEVRYFTRVIDADVSENRVGGVIIQNIEGLSYIPAKMFIDGTGDAVLSKFCGAVTRTAGTDTPNIMPATLPSIFAGIDFHQFRQIYGKEQTEMIEKEYALGNMTHCDRHLPGLCRVGETVGYLNGGHLYHLDATKCRDLSEGMMLGRKIAWEYLAMYRKYYKGCENAELVQTAQIMGVRESRRILGEYELTCEDFLARRKFPDQIGIFNKYIDIHPYDSSEAEWKRFNQDSDERFRLQKGESFGIPYGILVPKGFENLWTAGRCASTDVLVQGSIRVMPSSSMMGQAAGTAAVQAIARHEKACDLDTEQLVRTLRENGANLPQQKLSKTMTRNQKE